MQLHRLIIRILTISLVVMTPVSFAAEAKQQASQNQAQPAETTKEPISPVEQVTADEVEGYVKYYSGLGMHRAGSRIDRRATKWIETMLKRDKLQVTLDPIRFRRPVSRYAVVSMKVDRLNSVILPGMPLFNAPPTNHYIDGKLGFVGEDGTIPVIHIYVSPLSANAKLRSKSLKEFKDAIESGRYKAVIGVTEGGYAGLLPLAIDLNTKLKTPAMLMSSEIGNYADIFAQINNPVKFLTRLQYKESTVDNIITKIEGTDPTLSPVVVVVPRTAWWYAAAERGSGIASWLAAAKAFSKAPQRRTIWFISTGGQEFYSMGLKHFMESHPELKKAYAWIYIGGNVGTVPEPHYIVQTSTRGARRDIKKAFNEFDIDNVRWLGSSSLVLPALKPAFDEAENTIIVAATNNKCERMTCDKFPENVNSEATVKFAKALTLLIQNLASEG